MRATDLLVPQQQALRTYALEQRIRYGYSAPIRSLRQRLVVVPPAVHGNQRRQRWSIDVEGARIWRSWETSDAFGNLQFHTVVPRVADAVEFVVSSEVTVEEGVHRSRPDRRHVYATPLTAAGDDIRRLGDVGGVASADAAAVICTRVYESFTYEWGITTVNTTASEALAGGRGVCQDYAHVMIAACRASGIAARYVSGHLVGEGGSHAWVEVMRPDPDRPNTVIVEGWDPTHDRRTDGRYLTVAVGRDYEDVAPMSGTFEGHGVAGTLSVTKRLTVPSA